MAPSISADDLIEHGVGGEEAADLAGRIDGWMASLTPPETWRRITQEVLDPGRAFSLDLHLWDVVYADWDESEDGPRPAWRPQALDIRDSNLARLMRRADVTTYADLHEWSARNRASFWQAMVDVLGIPFREEPEAVCDIEGGVERPDWFPGGRLNIVESCFGADEDAPAVVFQPEGQPLERWTYGELRERTHRVARALTMAGFGPDDAIAVDMPMTAESVAIYLGIVAIGAAVVSIADSFSAQEIATRLAIPDADGIFTQDVIVRGGKKLPLYERVVEADAPRAIVLPGERDAALQADLREEDVTWAEFLSGAPAGEESFRPLDRGPGAMTNVLFSSGTTGEPKAIPWTQTSPIKSAADGWLHHDIRPGDVVCWPTNLGWMMGPWLIYASLVNDATIALYEGAPTGAAFGRFVQDAEVTMLGVVPSLVRSWRQSGCLAGLDWTSIRAFSSTGECSNAEDMLWLMSRAGYRPVIEYCGGTEIGGGYITGSLVQSASPATFSTPALGLDFIILDEDGHPANEGELFLVPPSIGLSTELLNRDHHEVYFAGTPRGPGGETLRRHGDRMERLARSYYRAHGRVDDTMNLGGIKVSAAEIERTLETVEAVAETAAIAVDPDEGGPSQLAVYAVPADGAEPAADDLLATFRERIREDLNPLFEVAEVVLVDELPRTASGKVMRRVLRAEHGD